MENRFNYRTPILLLFMLLIIGIRVIAPLSSNFSLFANFSALGAVALFGGAYFKNKLNAFILPMLVLVLSDLGLMLTMGSSYSFTEGWYYTYIAFALMVGVGYVVLNKVNGQRVVLASLIAVFIHWIVSDFGVWLGSTMYPQTIAGFWACLVAAIPFEKSFLYSTVIYSALMFGIFETLKVKYPSLAFQGAK